MKNRIDCMRKDKKHIIVYLMAGDPDIRTSEELALTLAENGVSMLEIGIPFSDPVADGKSIQAAALRSLKNRVSCADCISLAARIRKKTGIPMVFMTYFNIVLNYGIKRFVDDSLAAGADGAIIPDLPYDEEKEFHSYAEKKNFHIINLVSPANSAERALKIVEKTRGFVYYVLLKGVTGARKRNEADYSLINKIKKASSVPVFAGFGISTPQQAREALKKADGVIVGSAFVDMAAGHIGGKTALLRKAALFAKKFVKEAGNAGK
ncbi:MAG TPA: tryptophan synthase subunit alpha [Candidatus Goldiibacteriota bacterium]|nr:tryptophan synthase subunit alpha [Candidatus Goldiibacteriota bacterium]